MVKTFGKHYWSDACHHNSSKPLIETASYDKDMSCEPNVAFLSLILMVGTLWLGVTLFDFTRTPFLKKVRMNMQKHYLPPLYGVEHLHVPHSLIAYKNENSHNYRANASF